MIFRKTGSHFSGSCSSPPQACDRFGQFDGEKGQHEAHHRHRGTRYRQTSRVWAPAAVTIEAAHIAITIPARVKKAARRRRTAVTVQNMTAITKAVDNALNR